MRDITGVENQAEHFCLVQIVIQLSSFILIQCLERSHPEDEEELTTLHNTTLIFYI